MASIDILSNHRVHLPKPCIQLRRSHPVSCPILIHPKTSNFTRKNPIHSRFLLGSFTVFCKKKSESSSQVGEASATNKDDFVTRVLKDNPSQVEPKYRIGKKFYTLKEKEDLSRNSQLNFIELLSKRLNLKPKSKKESEEGRNETGVGDKAVYLKDILREHRGKLYVPEQMFGTALSEEEMFDRDLELLPRMSFENFQKAMRSDKVKSLTSKEDTGMPYGNRYRNFIVELKEIAGDKSLHRTKWVMRLDENESAALLEEYTGPLYETERHTTYLMGKVPEYPHPVASSVSSRIMVELGMLTVAIAVVAAVIGGFLASAVFAVTSFIFAATVFVVWPIVRPFLKIFLGLLLGILERVWDNVIDLFSDGGVFSKISEFYTFGGVSASLEMLKPIMMVLLTMVLLVRFTLSRRPKNFRKWDLWQGIDFSRSKAEARVDGSTGVKFSDVAGIDEAVEELQEVNKPSVIFIDEIDALATRRQGIFKESTDYLYNAATQERETTLNQLLIELDGFDTGKGVIFLAATNRRDLLDPALLRPGRFDRKIRIRPPNSKGRLDILKIHASKVKMSETVDLSICAQNLPGWTGARLAQLVQEAALVAVRKGHQSILQSDVDDAVDRLTVGPKRVGIELGHQGQCRRATTEVGVAMTSHLLRRYDNAKVEFCDRISIVPRGQTLSQLVFHRLDDESYIFERQPQLLHRLQVLLGGRAAEEVIYGRDTSRASVSYLADASWLARKILTIWNLENPMVIHGEPPPWKKSVKFVGPRLDFEGSLYDDYGLIEPPVNFNLDDQIAQRTEELIRNMYERTVSLLRRHHAALLKAVKVLLEQKEISGEELDFILSKYPPQTPISNLLEEENPGSLPFVKQERKLELEYAARLTTSQGET